MSPAAKATLVSIKNGGSVLMFLVVFTVPVFYGYNLWEQVEICCVR